MKIDKNLKKKLIEIAKKYNLDLLVLFGSRAKNTYNKNSDWDFAFYSKNDINYLDLYTEIENIIKNKIDLVNLNSDLEPLLKYNILKDGILIYEKEKGIFDEYFANTTIEYIDFKKYLKLEEEILNKKINAV